MKNWKEKYYKVVHDNVSIHPGSGGVFQEIENFIEQIISERDKETKEENNYQCVDCGNWNVKSPLTQCSECRRQD